MCFLARSLFAPFALDGTEDDADWDDEEEAAEDAEEPIDNEFETDSEAELSNKRFFSEP